jgi:hypothetical protein
MDQDPGKGKIKEVIQTRIRKWNLTMAEVTARVVTVTATTRETSTRVTAIGDETMKMKIMVQVAII